MLLYFLLPFGARQANSFIGAEEPMMTIQFSPDDERLAGCAADGKLYLYQTAGSSRKPKAILRSNVSRISNHVWSPNSKLIAGACSDGTMMVGLFDAFCLPFGLSVRFNVGFVSMWGVWGVEALWCGRLPAPVSPDKPSDAWRLPVVP